MGEVPSTGSAPVTPDEIREQIDETRRELGETVEALSAKTDVKAQARDAVQETKATVTGKVNQARTTVTDTTSDLLGKAKEISPDSALSAASTGSEKVRQNPLPAVAVGAFALGFLLGRVSRR